VAEIEIPEDRQYTVEDEWVRREDDRAVVGISDWAQQQLGDIVFVELPEVGRELAKGDAFGVIESVKAVSDLYAPISGTVAAVNGDLADRPELVNESCYGDGWMCAITPANDKDFEALLDAPAYRTHCEERGE
jgi:glycine cleavage system H protein